MFNKNSQHGSIFFIKSAGNISIPCLGEPPAVFEILTVEVTVVNSTFAKMTC